MRLHFKLTMFQNRLVAGVRSDPQWDIKHSPRLAKPQWATREETIPHTPSRSYGRFAVGNGRRRMTDRNRKGEQEGKEKFNLKQLLGLLPEIFMSKCTKNICRPGSARTPLRSRSAPTDPLAIVAGHRDRGIRDQDTQGDRRENFIQNRRCQQLHFQLIFGVDIWSRS